MTCVLDPINSVLNFRLGKTYLDIRNKYKQNKLVTSVVLTAKVIKHFM